MTEYDEETLRLMISYCGRDPRIPRAISIDVFSFCSSETWTLSEFQEILLSAIDEIPLQYRTTAKIEFDSGYYDEYGGSFELSYTRPQNDAEIEADVNRAYVYARDRLNQEYREYTYLKANFEGSSS
jgi:hypothetical protein